MSFQNHDLKSDTRKIMEKYIPSRKRQKMDFDETPPTFLTVEEKIRHFSKISKEMNEPKNFRKMVERTLSDNSFEDISEGDKFSRKLFVNRIGDENYFSATDVMIWSKAKKLGRYVFDNLDYYEILGIMKDGSFNLKSSVKGKQISKRVYLLFYCFYTQFFLELKIHYYCCENVVII